MVSDPERGDSRAEGESNQSRGTQQMAWYVYMLRCGNGDLYTGVTTDLERRVQEHRSKIGGRFTRAFQPVELAYSERAATESEAKHREAQLKAWSRAKKLALISGDRNALKSA